MYLFFLSHIKLRTTYWISRPILSKNWRDISFREFWACKFLLPWYKLCCYLLNIPLFTYHLLVSDLLIPYLTLHRGLRKPNCNLLNGSIETASRIPLFKACQTRGEFGQMRSESVSIITAVNMTATQLM